MLVIVEGLNGAGKSTVIKRWIDSGKAVMLPIDLPGFMNPVRFQKPEPKYLFDSYKYEIRQEINRRNDYIFTVYEMVAHFYKEFCKNHNKDVVIDRSFLSSYVYGTISRYAFLSICFNLKKILGNDFTFVVIKTPVELCIQRRKEDRAGKDYAILDEELQYDIDRRIAFAVKDAKRFFNIKYKISKEGML